MSGNGNDHPQWAIDQALELLRNLSNCSTHSEMMTFACLALRKAYHKGALDDAKEQLRKDTPH